MKRTEQREHISKLIFGADFNEESEQGTQTELYLESRSFNNFSTASFIFAFLNAVAKNFADPSGSSPALNPPENINI